MRRALRPTPAPALRLDARVVVCALALLAAGAALRVLDAGEAVARVEAPEGPGLAPSAAERRKGAPPGFTLWGARGARLAARPDRAPLAAAPSAPSRVAGHADAVWGERTHRLLTRVRQLPQRGPPGSTHGTVVLAAGATREPPSCGAA